MGGRHPLSFYLSSFLPPPPSLFLCHSRSVRTPLAPVAVTMRCRQRPQHVHCLGDERQTDTRSPSIRPCVRSSLPPLPRLSPVSRPPLILLTIFPHAPSSLSLSPSFSPSASFFFPLWAQEAQLPSKNTTEINKPLPLPPSPSLQLSLPLLALPPCYYSHNTHTPSHMCLFCLGHRQGWGGHRGSSQTWNL